MADTITKSEARAASAGSARQPVLIDLGKKKRKNVKKLRRGNGPLMRAVDQALAELRASGRVDNGGQDVIVLVREKRRRRDSWGF